MQGRIERSRFFLGISISGEIKGRGISIPLCISDQTTRITARKKAGSLEARSNQTWPLPTGNRTQNIGEGTALATRETIHHSRQIRIRAGENGRDPLIGILEAGLFGDGPTQVIVAGDQAFLTTSVRKGSEPVEVIARKGLRLTADITVK